MLEPNYNFATKKSPIFGSIFFVLVLYVFACSETLFVLNTILYLHFDRIFVSHSSSFILVIKIKTHFTYLTLDNDCIFQIFFYFLKVVKKFSSLLKIIIGFRDAWRRLGNSLVWSSNEPKMPFWWSWFFCGIQGSLSGHLTIREKLWIHLKACKLRSLTFKTETKSPASFPPTLHFHHFYKQIDVNINFHLKIY